ncbi:hypothetical protein D3C83_55630 [compost metagenome]
MRHGDARVERNDFHALRFVVEAEETEIGHHAEHAAGRKAALAARGAAAQESGARDEIDFFDEAPLLVLHRDDHLREARDVVAAAGAGQTRLRPRRVADER